MKRVVAAAALVAVVALGYRAVRTVREEQGPLFDASWDGVKRSSQSQGYWNSW